MTKAIDSRLNLRTNNQANPGDRFAVSTTRLLRDMNARQCLRVIRDRGPLSRADIARELGTTRATVGNAIRELVDGGLVSAADEANDVSQVGRPGANLCLEPRGAYFIGVEVQKQVLMVQLFDFAMELRATRQNVVNLKVDPLDKIASKIAETSLAVIRQANLRQEKIYGIGVSVPGIVSNTGRVIIPSIPILRGVDLKAILSKRVPKYWVLKICNNAAAVAFSLSESLEITDQQDFLFILLSQGVGSALVRNGKVEKGSHGFAGEIGHWIMSPRLSPRAESFGHMAGYERFLPFLNPRKTAAEALQELAAQRKLAPKLQLILQDWADVLSAGLLNAIHMIDPAHIMIGGPTAALYPRVAERVLETLEKSLLPGLEVPPIRLASSAANEVATGAAAYLRQDLFRLPDLRPQGGFY
jgi:predicted NBD/HSP70 family sugar kinase